MINGEYYIDPILIKKNKKIKKKKILENNVSKNLTILRKIVTFKEGTI